MTLIDSLKQKNILVLGAGITGLSCARFLRANNLCFAMNDSRKDPLGRIEPSSEALSSATRFKVDFPQAVASFGEWDTDLIVQADIILVSPGIDLEVTGINKHINESCKVWGDVELFCKLNNEMKAPVGIVAVTGSNGKSTVVSLLHSIGQSMGKQVSLGGNIGQPVLDLFTKNAVQSLDLLVLELSSFQLETLNSMKALGATVLNVSDDHLDRHQTLENYQAIKQKIYLQTNVVITNRDDSLTDFSKESSSTSKLVSFGSDIPSEGDFGIANVQISTKLSENSKDNAKEKLMLMHGSKALVAINKLPLTGIHNALNYLAAMALGQSAGWSITEMIKHFNTFKGLAHRCQLIESEDGIVWINDSKATNVGSTIAAVNGLAPTIPKHNKLILIAGGEGKGADFSPLKEVIEEQVSHLITLGKDGNKISQLVADNQAILLHRVKTIKEAVKVAHDLAILGDIVLLSPACASLDMFKNFNDRGDQFVQAVQAVVEKAEQETEGEL